MSLKDLLDIIFFMIVWPILPEAPATMTLIGFIVSRINELYEIGMNYCFIETNIGPRLRPARRCIWK